MRDRVRNERSTVPSLLVTSSDAFGHTHRSARRHVTHGSCAVVVSRAHMVRWALRVTPLGKAWARTVWQRDSAVHPAAKSHTQRTPGRNSSTHNKHKHAWTLSVTVCFVTLLLLCSLLLYSFSPFFSVSLLIFCFQIVPPNFHLFSCFIFSVICHFSFFKP